jgi:hypothetical protein
MLVAFYADESDYMIETSEYSVYKIDAYLTNDTFILFYSKTNIAYTTDLTLSFCSYI